MKLREFKKWIDFCIEGLDDSDNPDILFELDDSYIKVASIGQFGVAPDVVVYLEDI